MSVEPTGTGPAAGAGGAARPAHPPGPHDLSMDMMKEIESLRARLAVAEETLAAIRAGEVDALVVAAAGGERVYTLEGAETPYRVLVEQMQEGAVIVNAAGTVVYSNRRFAELLGVPLERVTGSDMRGFSAEGETGALDAVLRQGGARASTGETRLRGPGGRGVPVLVAASPMPADEAARTCVIVTDLTAQKRTQELEEARDALARKAAELTRSNADLGNFAHVAAHDLKEPLRGMRHIVGFLNEDFGEMIGQEGRAKLESLDRLSGRMTMLLDAMLEYSRVGQGEPRMRRVDLGVVVAEVLAGMAPWLKERGAEVTVGVLPAAWCDPVQVGRLFQILVTNGAQYNESSPRRVEIDSVHSAAGGPELIVRDNGIGIPAEHHERIFQMFKRLVRDGRYGEGTGAGLSIAQRIVERHGGRLRVESAPGKGATFHFTLGSGEPGPAEWNA